MMVFTPPWAGILAIGVSSKGRTAIKLAMIVVRLIGLRVVTLNVETLSGRPPDRLFC